MKKGIKRIFTGIMTLLVLSSAGLIGLKFLAASKTQGNNAFSSLEREEMTRYRVRQVDRKIRDSVEQFVNSIPSIPKPAEEFTPGRLSVLLEYVVDGDTIVCDCKGQKMTVRLLGIDTPESRDNKRARIQAREMNIPIEEVIKKGLAAKKHLKSLVAPGDSLMIELDKPTKDKYGRVLGYVFAGNRFINAEMLSSGHAALFMSDGLQRENELIKSTNKGGS